MSRKDDNAVKAKEWVEALMRNGPYSADISRSIEKTIILQKNLVSSSDLSYVRKAAKGKTPIVEVTGETTYEAACRLRSEGYLIAVLNFASYYKPGGGYLKGAMAQEESLCAVSGLYPVLSTLRVYKDRRNRKDVPDEYDDELIYSPMVPFTVEEGKLSHMFSVDVISCAAPNCNRILASRVGKINEAINRRLTACYTIPYMHGVTAIVLGAWGCGVFKNDPVYVAKCFKRLNEEFGGCYSKVVYALPNDSLKEQFADIMVN